MDFKKLLVNGAFAGVAVAAVGCGGDDGGGTMMMPPPPPALCTSGTCAPRFYVVNTLGIVDATAEPTRGFNLDGNAVLECPGLEPGDSENGGGIDNVLGGPAGIGSVVGNAIQRAVDDGDVIILLQVDGVDDLVNDPNVNLQLFLGKLPAGATLMKDMETGRISAGQTFDIVQESVMAGTMDSLVVFRGARISGGTLTAGPSVFPLSLRIMGFDLALNIQQAQLRFGITETALTNGTLGGALNVDQLKAAAMMIPDLRDYVDLLDSVVVPDLSLTMGTMCRDASIALEIAGVAATRGAIVPSGS
jgi:hypothetical protein